LNTGFDDGGIHSAIFIKEGVLSKHLDDGFWDQHHGMGASAGAREKSPAHTGREHGEAFR
jgi:hypothetical protein